MFGVAGLRACKLAAPADEAPWRVRSRLRFGVWALLWVAGHVAGGALLGAALGWSGAWLPASQRTLASGALLVGCLAGGLHQLRLITLPMPQLDRQVQQYWVGRLPWDALALGYGLQLGCGVATRIKVATTYVVLGFALLSSSAAAGASLMGLFGLARSILPVALGPSVASPRGSLAFTVLFDTYQDRVGRLNGVVLLLAATLLGILLWHSSGA